MENITNLSTIDIRAVIWDNYIKDKFKEDYDEVVSFLQSLSSTE